MYTSYKSNRDCKKDRILRGGIEKCTRRSLNARNRYKSDRDCERRRADIQRPFAMPGIERGGCSLLKH